MKTLFSAVVALLVAVCFPLVVVRSAGATTSGGNGAIAFASSRDGNVEIWRMQPHGSGLTRLTDIRTGLFEAAEYPSWSPDGAKVAFDSLNRTVYVMDGDGSDLAPVIGGSSVVHEFPAWSPDGQLLAMTSDAEGPAGFYNIYSVRSDGTSLHRLSFGGADFYPAWSPDGTKIAFTHFYGGTTAIFVMNSDGTGLKQLTDGLARDEKPDWSPDGSKIVFASNRDGDYEIYVMNTDGTGAKRLTDSPGLDFGPTWSPDGTKIAFTSSRDGNFEIYVMSADGSSPTRLTNDSGIDTEPSWQPTNLDATPPTIATPQGVNADAATPTGSTVEYTVTATDPDDAVASLTCTPSSGSGFAIGTTTVTCAAVDTHGNTASASFTVHVRGAVEQLVMLSSIVQDVGPGTSLADKLDQTQAALAASDRITACSKLAAFARQVAAQTGKLIDPVLAAQVTEVAARITAVVGC